MTGAARGVSVESEVEEERRRSDDLALPVALGVAPVLKRAPSTIVRRLKNWKSEM